MKKLVASFLCTKFSRSLEWRNGWNSIGRRTHCGTTIVVINCENQQYQHGLFFFFADVIAIIIIVTFQGGSLLKTLCKDRKDSRWKNIRLSGPQRHRVQQGHRTRSKMRGRTKNSRILLSHCPLEYKEQETQTSVEITNEDDWFLRQGQHYGIPSIMQDGRKSYDHDRF